MIFLSRRKVRSRRAFTPSVSGLEDRKLLSTFTVTNTFASGSGSLAGAVQQANLAGGANTINFAAGVTGQITLASQIDITEAGPLTITGPGAGVLSVSDPNGRVFETHNSSVSISGLTFSNSHATSNDFTPGAGGDGGAIQEDGGSLTLSGCQFFNNTASNRGGAVFNFYGSLTSTGNVFVGNSTSHHGGAIYDSGTMIATGNLFSANTAGEGGGAVEVARSILGIGGVSGTVTGSIAVGNSARYGGAIAVDNTSFLSLTGGSTLISNRAMTNGGGLAIGSGSTAVVTGDTIDSNTAIVNGGGIYNLGNLSLSGTTLQFNSAVLGGAYYSDTAGLTLGPGNLISFNTQPQTWVV